ncbi:hypothetical protein T06_2580, partial [Trichinella sp. T6]
MSAASNPNSSIFPNIGSYPLLNSQQVGNQQTDVSIAQQALLINQQ